MAGIAFSMARVERTPSGDAKACICSYLWLHVPVRKNPSRPRGFNEAERGKPNIRNLERSLFPFILSSPLSPPPPPYPIHPLFTVITAQTAPFCV